MPITGIRQPEVIQIEDGLRLRKNDGIYDFAFDWYQDEDTVCMVDGVRKKYSRELLAAMYEYKNDQGELYFIEVLEHGTYRPIGDVTFWKDDLPIVIGERTYRGRGIAKKVIRALIQRGRELGYDSLRVQEIYAFNEPSRRCFESLGFCAYEKTEKGDRFLLKF